MSLSQWTFDGGGSHALNTSSPIEGVSHLRLVADTNSSKRAWLTSGADLTTGKIRSLIRIPAVGSFASVANLGLFGMRANVTTGDQASYWGYFGGAISGYPYTPTVAISKGGFPGQTLLASVAGPTFTNATTWKALELEWQRDADSGFVLLTVRTGSLTDYSDLTTVLTYTDNSAPYSVAATAGLTARRNDGITVDFDKTDIYRPPA